jgi:hypothetical protein
MGYAARRNPLSREGGKDPQHVAMAQIVRGCQWVKTPNQLEALLDRIVEREPDIDVDKTRDFLWEFCAFDPAAIEAEERQLAHARRMEEILAKDGRKDMYDQLVKRLPPDMQRAFAILNGVRNASH